MTHDERNEACEAALREFMQKLEDLGAVAGVGAYTVDRDDEWGANAGVLGEGGPALFFGLDRLLDVARDVDVVAVCGVAAKFATPPDDVDFEKQAQLLAAGFADAMGRREP